MVIPSFDSTKFSHANPTSPNSDHVHSVFSTPPAHFCGHFAKGAKDAKQSFGDIYHVHVTLQTSAARAIFGNDSPMKLLIAETYFMRFHGMLDFQTRIRSIQGFLTLQKHEPRFATLWKQIISAFL